MTVLLSRSGISKVQQYAPYLTKDDFLESIPVPGSLLEYSNGTSTIAYGYSGKGHRYNACITDEPISDSLFLKQIKRALNYRLSQFDKLPEAYRLIHNEADRLPGITIEIFQKYAVLTYFNQGIITYEGAIVKALRTIVTLEGVYAKYRTPETTQTHTQLIWGTEAPAEIIIQEPIGKYSVRLADGLMTGLFLDQRANRQWLYHNSSNKNVCNTFSYTGSLSVACGLGNATSTKSIDLAKTYTEWSQHNLAINDLTPPKHEAISSDTFAHFAYCTRKSIQYDLIILDPPTFSKNKKGTFSVPENYSRLAKEAYALLSKNGILMCCTNYSQWSQVQFKQVLQKALPPSAKIFKECGADRDFPKHPHWSESEHLKCVFIEKWSG
jgi:23S rRNA (cytosine1962-C5)-methyltransferase